MTKVNKKQAFEKLKVTFYKWSCFGNREMTPFAIGKFLVSIDHANRQV